ncbi:DUF2953 domain-containing protein [Paenibacillus barcinonensis]|uniref:DUF2953 domain-containing protein n=1 Tax=Paenibacillus barcinonensis TaxID=198119 RepID=A0A2V4VDY9_PAEBA|nr:DUF2953 domain-containing protein [Paenibacillus barcinonensis]PYE51678.1 hypothetical protein DFQ00_102473 [Paenibacillus barcinonensis]QKS56037.1 DUF2953 domain-containing protein [Paenibacillus barcinonensis]
MKRIEGLEVRPVWIWLGGIGLFIALLIAAVLISNVHVHVVFRKHKSDDYANINIRLLYGIVRFNYEIPSIVFRNMKEGFLLKTEQSMNHSRGEVLGSQQVNKRKVKNWAKDVKVMLRATEALKLWVKQTLQRVHITRLLWSTTIGTGDAAYTAMLTGMLWSVKSMMIGFLTYQMRFRTAPVLEVNPFWADEPEFRTELELKLRMRMLAILTAGMRLMTRVLQVEGGWRMWLKLIQEQRRKFKEKKKYKHIVDKEPRFSEK